MAQGEHDIMDVSDSWTRTTIYKGDDFEILISAMDH